MEHVFMEHLLDQTLDLTIVKNFINGSSSKSFISDIDTVNRKIKKAILDLTLTSKLLDKFQSRTNLINKEVERIVGIKDYGSFKKSDFFNKKSLCLLAICFHLNDLESDELLLSASIKLDPYHNIFDCVYSFYIKNYHVVADPELNVEEFNRCLRHAEQYVSKKVLEQGI